MPELIAMTPTGDVVISRRNNGEFWLHLPAGVRGAGPLEEDQVARYVVNGGLVRINEHFTDYADLDRRVDEIAARATPPLVIDDSKWDRTDVERMMNVAAKWEHDGDDARALKLLKALLSVPAVMGDARQSLAVAQRIAEVAERVAKTAETPRASIEVQTFKTLDDQKVEAAQERWQLHLAA